MSGDGTQHILAALGRLETKMETRLDSLETKVGSLETKVDNLEIRLDKTRTDIMDRIDRVQHRVDQTHDKIAVNFGNPDRVERIARSAMDDGRTTSEILRVMQRQIMRLETDVEHLKGPP